jgi:hypothetical protein
VKKLLSLKGMGGVVDANQQRRIWELLVHILLFSYEINKELIGNLAWELLVQILILSYEINKEFIGHLA